MDIPQLLVGEEDDALDEPMGRRRLPRRGGDVCVCVCGVMKHLKQKGWEHSTRRMQHGKSGHPDNKQRRRDGEA